MWEKKSKGTIECDKITITCDVGTAQYENETVTCDVRTVQCEDWIVKCEKKKKVRKPLNVTKELSYVMLKSHNVRMKPSSVRKK